MSAATSPLLGLFQSLTERVPEWGVWKNAEASLRGEGDVDSSGPEAAAPVVFEAFAGWARAGGAGAAVRCPHSPGLTIMVAAGRNQPELLQFDLWHRAHLRAAEVLDWRRILPLMEMDERGFRRSRRGAEGVLLMLFNGMRRGGRPDAAALERKHVRELLVEDPGGVPAAVAALGLPRSVEAVAAAVVAGKWDRPAALTVEAGMALRALRRPLSVSRRLAFRARPTPCAVIAALAHRREVPSRLDRWLEEVAASHEVVRL
ncbi:MAG TPA: hypothetical protein VG318_09860 [Actinomycetota bacterium]|nr:hypothetical protein [Actinomycetota bacterium]